MAVRGHRFLTHLDVSDVEDFSIGCAKTGFAGSRNGMESQFPFPGCFLLHFLSPTESLSKEKIWLEYQIRPSVTNPIESFYKTI